jgi:hypothetical protein
MLKKSKLMRINTTLTELNHNTLQQTQARLKLC